MVLFGRLAEVTCRYMDKGRLVAVEGRLVSRSYDKTASGGGYGKWSQT